MVHIDYKVIKHGESSSYHVGDMLSEALPEHDVARRVAHDVARENAQSGNTFGITYEIADRQWLEELADRSDRSFTSAQA